MGKRVGLCTRMADRPRPTRGNACNDDPTDQSDKNETRDAQFHGARTVTPLAQTANHGLVLVMARRPSTLIAIALAVVVVFIVARVVIGVVIEKRVRAALSDLGEETGTFNEASISLSTLTMTVTNLKIVARDKPDREPVVHARVASAEYQWGELLSGKPVLRFRGTGAKFAIYSGGGTKSDLDIADIEQSIDDGLPGVLDGLQVRDGELLIVDLSGKKPKQIWFHQMDVDLTGLRERGWKSPSATIRFSGHGTLQHSGDAHLDIEAVNNVPAGTVTVKGTGKLAHFALADAYDYISEACGLSVQRGTMSLALDFTTDIRKFEGNVDADYRGLEIVAANNGVINQLKEAAVDIRLSSKSTGEAGHDFRAQAKVHRTGEPDDSYIDNLIDLFHAMFTKAVAGAFGAA